MNDRVKQTILYGCVIAIAVLALWRHSDSTRHQSTMFTAINRQQKNVEDEPVFRSQFISQSLSDFSHAASITELRNGDLLAVWFSGSREGADDVQISQARFDQQQQTWLPARAFLTREHIIEQQQLFTGKLGNPVIATAPDGKLWFFVVAATYFGWGSSTINVTTSDDDGLTWSPIKRLQLTPFFNLSSLIRNAPTFYSDGSVGLPIYRESAGKFPQWLRLDKELNVVDQARVNGGRHNLQPATVAFGDRDLQMFMRSADSKTGKVLMAQSTDGGQHWSPETLAPVPNPNSGLSAVQYDANSMLVALNDVEKGRHQLSLYRVSRADLRWTKLREIESSQLPGATKKLPYNELLPTLKQAIERNQKDNPAIDFTHYLANLEQDHDRLCGEQKTCEFYYDYPYLYRDSKDQFHLLYSWNKSFIKHIVFNRAALELKP